MEEKILIKSEQYNIKKIQKIIIGAGLIVFLIIFLKWGLPKISKYGVENYFDFEIKTLEDFGLLFTEYYHFSFGVIYGILIPVIISVFIYGWLKSYELTITNARVFGKVAFGKRVDLPIDSVSATAIIRLVKGVSVLTSSGRVSFLAIKNTDEIHSVLSDLIIARQDKSVNNIIKQEIPQSNAEELKKYKDLLDNGIITQEEFDQKKKQLLSL